jgi:hypothetical protein
MRVQPVEMTTMPRVTAVAVTGAALVMAISTPASASFVIDHAFVPGIGWIGTSLPSDTEVRPPGYIPPPENTSYAEEERQRQREYRLAGRTHAGPDVGRPDRIKRIKRDFARGLFLSKVALTCTPFPKAGRWVYRYVFLPPGRRVYEDQFEFERVHSQDRPPRCARFRLKIARWQGVRVGRTGDHARLMARGTYENDLTANGTWERRYRFIWKAAVERKDRHWHITVISEEPLDDIVD